MDIETLNQRLADVDAAISNIMKGGQVIQTRNGKVQQASLSELRAERAALEQQIAEFNASGRSEYFGTPLTYYGRR